MTEEIKENKLRENFTATMLFYEQLMNYFSFMKKDKTIDERTLELLNEPLSGIMYQYQDLYYNIDRYYKDLVKRCPEVASEDF